MALLFWEGFDSYSDITQLAISKPNIYPGLYARIPSVYGPFLVAGVGRFGGRAITGGQPASGYIDISSANASEIYTGRAVITNQAYGFMFVYEQTDNGGGYPTPAVTVQYAGSGQINIWRGRAFPGYGSDVNKVLIGQSALNVYNINVWNWVELRVKMSSSSTTNDGIVELWLNNQKIISNTACVTKNYASTYYRGIGLCTEYGASNDFNNLIDDIYIVDTTGPAPWNDRLGDCRIASVALTSDSGPNDFGVSTGNTNHYTVVDEIPYSASDWLSTSALNSGFGEMFRLAGLPSTNTFSVLSTAVVAVGGKTDAGNAAFKISIRSGSTRANSNTQYLSTTNTYYSQEWVTNPNTSAQWTVSEWANANVGVYVV